MSSNRAVCRRCPAHAMRWQLPAHGLLLLSRPCIFYIRGAGQSCAAPLARAPSPSSTACFQLPWPLRRWVCALCPQNRCGAACFKGCSAHASTPDLQRSTCLCTRRSRMRGRWMSPPATRRGSRCCCCFPRCGNAVTEALSCCASFVAVRHIQRSYCSCTWLVPKASRAMSSTPVWGQPADGL